MRKVGSLRPAAALAAAVVALVATALTPATAAPGSPSPPVLGAFPIDAGPGAAPAGVARALAGPLADPGLGGSPHVAVMDAVSGRVLLDRMGRVPAIPASTEKLLTAGAALTVLGARSRLSTKVYAAGPDIYLVGGGDPTLSSQQVVAYPNFANVSTLAGTVARTHHLIRRVIAVSPLYGGPDVAPGWSPSYLTEGEIAPVRSLVVDEAKLAPGLGPGARASDPVSAAAEKFQAALKAAGVQAGPVSVGDLPKGARLVGTAYSPPVSALVEHMLNFSDDDLAEGLGRQVALRLGLPATFAGVGRALGRVATRLALPAGSRIYDASGLSRDDALAPETLAELLHKAVTGEPSQLRTLLSALPVAGFSGTLAVRFGGSSAAAVGMVRAKTGWLNNAAGLAGVVTTADGQLLVFAALVPAPDRSAGETALDRVAATLAACGCH